MGKVSLTYEELGHQLGLSSSAAARMRAKRRHWHTIRGNDGLARVEVDESELVAERAEVERQPEHVRERLVEQFRTEAERWRTLAEERGTALARMEGEATGLRMVLDELRARVTTLEQGRDHERRQHQELVDELKAQVARERGRRREAEARLALPWWRRLLG
jgi:hypothetical protein